MSLLPSNQPLKKQDFAVFLDTRTITDYKELTRDPLKCHSSLLAHIALSFGVDISGMKENKAREYLANLTKSRNIAGSVKAVENAIDIYLGVGELVEWFDDSRLSPGHFVVNTTQDEVKTFLENIKYFKNVRSKLVSVSDNKCAHRARFDITRYDESILDDTAGVLVNGVRVCFEKSSFKFTTIPFSATIKKATEIINNKSISSSTLKESKKELVHIVNKGALIARGWVGSWLGSWGDRYKVVVNKVTVGE